jgi:hypothetical protein
MNLSSSRNKTKQASGFNTIASKENGKGNRTHSALACSMSASRALMESWNLRIGRRRGPGSSSAARAGDESTVCGRKNPLPRPPPPSRRFDSVALHRMDCLDLFFALRLGFLFPRVKPLSNCRVPGDPGAPPLICCHSRCTWTRPTTRNSAATGPRISDRS